MWWDAAAGDAAGMTTVVQTHPGPAAPNLPASSPPAPNLAALSRPTPSPPAPSRPTPSQPTPWRLRGRARKTVLIAHILSVGTWVGIDVLVGLLVLTGWLSTDPALRGAAYQALGEFVLWPMLTAALASLVTGVILGLGSKYGLVRYWWVAVKLVLNVVLGTLIVVLLRPMLAELAEYGRAVAAGTAADRDLSQLFFPPAVSLTALTVATVLSVAKPWGRTRRTGS